MEQWIELGKELREFVNPSTMPVAVKFLKDEKMIPQKARRPQRDLGVKIAPCQGAAMARRYGWTVALAGEDVGCAIANHTYGWEKVLDTTGAIDFLVRMNYASDDKAAAEVFAGFRLLEMGQDAVVVYSPLERTRVDPDVVLIGQAEAAEHAGGHRGLSVGRSVIADVEVYPSLPYHRDELTGGSIVVARDGHDGSDHSS